MAQFVPTATNMVAIVRNTIQGYGMGPIRALAQEPVQNSKDAARGNASVEYKLHRRSGADGAVTYLLTVTDHNTSGLRGSIRSLADLPAQGQALNEGENWAAFEGMGYTKKSSEDALGSRGPGQVRPFLYHSILPSAEFTKQERMMILYDTLLPDSEYRLGVRYANPSDFVLSPPHTGDEARRVVSSHYVMEDGTVFNLELDPLTEIGTRIIVPCLSEEATAAFRSGELYRWLQRCWWRAVQTGLSITLVDEHGVPQSVVCSIMVGVGTLEIEVAQDSSALKHRHGRRSEDKADRSLIRSLPKRAGHRRLPAAVLGGSVTPRAAVD